MEGLDGGLGVAGYCGLLCLDDDDHIGVLVYVNVEVSFVDVHLVDDLCLEDGFPFEGLEFFLEEGLVWGLVGDGWALEDVQELALLVQGCELWVLLEEVTVLGEWDCVLFMLRVANLWLLVDDWELVLRPDLWDESWLGDILGLGLVCLCGIVLGLLVKAREDFLWGELIDHALLGFEAGVEDAVQSLQVCDFLREEVYLILILLLLLFQILNHLL